MTLQIDASAIVSPLSDIEDSVRGSIIRIGKRTRIDSFVKIKPAGGSGDVEIGDDCFINSGTVIYSGNGVRLGNSVLVAANCTFASTSHEFSDRGRTILDQGFFVSRGGIVIEDDVWIGSNCVILDGSVIRSGSVIGAQSLVTGELDGFGVYYGIPARRIRDR
jgi:acetyltransferase-like isoleucine patch superfamily enzyme